MVDQAAICHIKGYIHTFHMRHISIIWYIRLHSYQSHTRLSLICLVLSVRVTNPSALCLSVTTSVRRIYISKELLSFSKSSLNVWVSSTVGENKLARRCTGKLCVMANTKTFHILLCLEGFSSAVGMSLRKQQISCVRTESLHECSTMSPNLVPHTNTNSPFSSQSWRHTGMA